MLRCVSSDLARRQPRAVGRQGLSFRSLDGGLACRQDPARTISLGQTQAFGLRLPVSGF
jgi:hypothetical protein